MVRFSVSMSLRALSSDLASKRLSSSVKGALFDVCRLGGNCLDVIELNEVWKTVSSRKRPSWARRLQIVRSEATMHLSWMLNMRT